MNFEEIFDEPGWYVADSFAEGVCFEVTKEGNLQLLAYENKDSITPHRDNAVVYKELFSKEYTRVFTRQALFK